MKTFLPQISELERTWYVVDADDQILGRMATRIASFLMGKEKPIYTDFLDTGDFVVVVNIDKVRLSGKNGMINSIIPIVDIRGGLSRFPPPS